MSDFKPYQHPFESPYVTWAEVVEDAKGNEVLRDVAGNLLKSNYWQPMDQDDLYDFVSRQFAEIAYLSRQIGTLESQLNELGGRLSALEDTVRDQD